MQNVEIKDQTPHCSKHVLVADVGLKERCLISFSGGETSAYMLWWLLTHKSDVYDFVIIFANTGQENEETLEFVRNCENHFGCKIVWVEAVPRMFFQGRVNKVEDWLNNIQIIKWIGKKLGTKHRVVDFETANRDGKVYETVIARYGIPNAAGIFCTRELKLRPITSYLRSIGWKKGTYQSAIGIRADEFDRMNKDRVKEKLYYPLIKDQPMTKPKINFWWKLQPFRLELKGYQGNCKWCFKKSDNKLYQLAQETPEIFEFPDKMEQIYGNWIPPDRLAELIEKGKEIPKNIKFFRNHKSAKDILENSKTFDKNVKDDSDVYDDTESCDIYAECGS